MVLNHHIDPICRIRPLDDVLWVRRLHCNYHHNQHKDMLFCNNYYSLHYSLTYKLLFDMFQLFNTCHYCSSIWHLRKLHIYLKEILIYLWNFFSIRHFHIWTRFPMSCPMSNVLKCLKKKNVNLISCDQQLKQQWENNSLKSIVHPLVKTLSLLWIVNQVYFCIYGTNTWGDSV